MPARAVEGEGGARESGWTAECTECDIPPWTGLTQQGAESLSIQHNARHHREVIDRQEPDRVDRG